MKIKLVIRHDEDWQALTRKSYIRPFYNIHYHNNNKMENLKKNLDGWDKLNLSMFEYRDRLKKIATSNWPYNIEWVFLEDALADQSPNIVYIPMDDDDIINPSLIDELYNIYQDKNIKSVVWKTWGYSVLNDRPTLFDESKRAWLIPSNCYSIRGDCVTFGNLFRHKIFSETIESYYIIDKKYGLVFHHPASTYKMQQKYLMDKIKVKNVSIPPQLKWGKRFIDDVNILTRKLYDK